MNNKDPLANAVPGTPRLKEEARVEQRKHQRFPSELSVLIHWNDDSGNLRDAPGIIVNVSAGGFGVELGRPFPTGSLVSVETHAGSLQCVVRHVQERSGSCRLGMEVLAASDGSNHQNSLDNLAVALGESDEDGPE